MGVAIDQAREDRRLVSILPRHFRAKFGAPEVGIAADRRDAAPFNNQSPVATATERAEDGRIDEESADSEDVVGSHRAASKTSEPRTTGNSHFPVPEAGKKKIRAAHAGETTDTKTCRRPNRLNLHYETVAFPGCSTNLGIISKGGGNFLL